MAVKKPLKPTARSKIPFSVLFWIKSSRGTDNCAVFQYPQKVDKSRITADLEEWCAGFTAWVVSENHVSYGYRVLKHENRAATLKKFKAACEAKNKVDKRWRELRARLCVISRKG